MQDNHTPSPADRTYPHSKRIRIDDSILTPSVPIYFIEKWNFDPADSFNLLPVVDLGQNYKFSPELPLAPVWRRTKTQYTSFEEYKYRVWTAGVCPFCCQDHLKGKRQYSDAGVWNCDRGMPVFWMIPVSNRPSDREMIKYFPMWAPRGSNRPQGGLYLIRAGGRYKIGISSNPEKRIASIATASPFPIETVHIQYTDSHQQLEKQLHRQLADFRVHLEWFEFPDDLIPAVIDLIKGGVK